MPYNNIFDAIDSNKHQLRQSRAHSARADARTAFQDLLFVKMVRSDDDDDDATKATDPRVGFRFV